MEKYKLNCSLSAVVAATIILLAVSIIVAMIYHDVVVLLIGAGLSALFITFYGAIVFWLFRDDKKGGKK